MRFYAKCAEPLKASVPRSLDLYTNVCCSIQDGEARTAASAALIYQVGRKKRGALKVANLSSYM